MGVDTEPLGGKAIEEYVATLAREAEGRKAPMLEVYEWVFNHVLVPWEDIKPEEVPSTGAVGLLKHAKDEDCQAQFYQQAMPRLLPSRSQLEQAEAFSDDGRPLEQLFDLFEKEYRRTVVG